MKKIYLFLMISILVLTVGCSKTTPKNMESLDGNQENISSQENENVYGVYESNSNWAIKPTPENLLDDSYSVVKVKINSIENAKFIENLDYDKPLTPINVEVITVLEGEYIPNNATIYITGGNISLEEVIKHQTVETNEKMGLNEIPESERKLNYIKYSSEEYFNFELGEEYIVILDREANDIYSISADGYGIFKSQNNEKSNEETLVNVLTGENLKLN